MSDRTKLLKHLSELDQSIAQLEEILADVPMTKAQRLRAEGQLNFFRLSLERVETMLSEPNDKT